MGAPRFVAMDTETYQAFLAGRPDDNGQPPERLVCDGSGLPCRHCLADIGAGESALLLAWRPFDAPQPYAETGPVFVHAERCRRFDARSAGLPPILRDRPQVVVRGYDARQRIVYGSGSVQPTSALLAHCETLLADPRIEFLHLRSASAGCYQCRVERGAPA